MARADTKTRILDAAQAEFSELGFDGASIRGIAQKAGVQIAGIRYHLGSKEDLFRAVFARHAEEVVRRREAYYEEIAAQKGTPDLRQAVVAMLGPLMGVRFEAEGGHSFAKLMANTVSNPDKRSTKLTKELFDPASRDIIAHFQEAMPDLNDEEAYWSFFLSVGSLAMLSSNSARLERLSGGLCDLEDQQVVTENLITFVIGGIEALAEKSAEKKKAPRPSAARKTEAALT